MSTRFVRFENAALVSELNARIARLEHQLGAQRGHITHLRRTLALTAAPLETILTVDRDMPYSEISPSFKAGIVRAVERARAALSESKEGE